MSSTTPSAEVNEALSKLERLLQIANHYYTDASSLIRFGWDFQKHQLHEAGQGDDLARFVCAELQEACDPKAGEVEQLIAASSLMRQAATDLRSLSEGLERHTVMCLARAFAFWVVDIKRTSISKQLIRSWIEVHPTPGVQVMADQVVDLVWDALLPAAKLRSRDTQVEVVNVVSDNWAELLAVADALVVVTSVV